MASKPYWLDPSNLLPGAALLVLILILLVGINPLLGALCAAALIAAIVVAVHHAEVLAHQLGEPLGTLVLALSVTAIETALILSMMLSGGSGGATLARDTVYAAIMIICCGVIGVCLLVGSIAHHEQSFRAEGAGGGLAALMVMAVLVLVLPNFTTTSFSGTLVMSQQIFVACALASLWLVFVMAQTGRYRSYFVPSLVPDDPPDDHGLSGTTNAWASFAQLLISLIAVVGLAKMLTPMIENGLTWLGAPNIVVGIVIAALVLMPETWAAVRAARANRLQSSMNLAIGSALASIGLTIPVVIIVSLLFDLHLTLGLQAREMVLLLLTLIVSGVTLSSGRTWIMLGAVHLVLFAAFLFFAFVG